MATKYVFSDGFEVNRTHNKDNLTDAIYVYLHHKLGYPFILNGLSQSEQGTYLAETTDRDYKRSTRTYFKVREINR